MSERPPTSTIVPPPDRTRKTDPPLPTDKPPPEFLAMSEKVVDVETQLGDLTSKVDAILAHMKTLIDVGLGQAFHDLNKHLTVIKANSELVLERHAGYANEVARVHQENVSIRFDVEDHETRIGRLESDRPPGPNGHSK